MGKLRPSTDSQGPKYLRRADLLARWNISNMTLERRINEDPDFPPWVKFEAQPRAWRYWLTSDIEAYERKRAADVPNKKTTPRRRLPLKSDGGTTIPIEQIASLIATLKSGKKVRVANLKEVLAA